MVPFIGITGPARHGKDTVGNLIKEEIPAFTLFAFADALKSFVRSGFDAPKDEWEAKEDQQVFTSSRHDLVIGCIGHLYPARHLYVSTDSNVRKNYHDIDTLIEMLRKEFPDFKGDNDGFTFTASWRHLWQLVGTDWARGTIHEDFWVTPFMPTDGYHIVTDVRGHGDREDFMEQNNEAVAVIERGGIIIRVVDPRKGDMVRHHHSESGIDDVFVSLTIINDGSLEDLRGKVRDFIDTWLVRDGV